MVKKIALGFQAFLLLVVLRLLLSFVNLQPTLDWVRKCRIIFFFNNNVNRNRRTIQIASKFIPRSTCLVQAMAFKILCRDSLGVRLVIGIRNDSKFESHAWVAINDTIIFGNSENNKSFTELLSI